MFLSFRVNTQFRIPNGVKLNPVSPCHVGNHVQTRVKLVRKQC
jgi:hypothetical protein